MTFFVSLFILLMQFLWKYIDDLVGKGLEWLVIGELMFYASEFSHSGSSVVNSHIVNNDDGRFG
jgi:hypothetical protein